MPSNDALSPGATLLRLAAIGAMLAGAAGLFLYTAGYFSPHRLTPDRMLAAVTAPKGPTPGFRRNHAKGVCATGFFDSNGAGAALSKAALFKPGHTPLHIGITRLIIGAVLGGVAGLALIALYRRLRIR